MVQVNTGWIGAATDTTRIAEGEQAIMDEAISLYLPVVLVADNGFPKLYHPSSHRIHLCAEGKLLIVTPWLYSYRSKKESISAAYCKTMNCVVQSLCRLKDTWWKWGEENKPKQKNYRFVWFCPHLFVSLQSECVTTHQKQIIN